MRTISDKINHIKSLIRSGYDTDTIIRELDTLHRYYDEDKPWCEYLPEENAFLVEWEDKEYKYAKTDD